MCRYTEPRGLMDNASMGNSPIYNRGLILFAHGSRDPRWSEPFQRVRDLVATQAPHLSVALAYLESATPDLEQAVATLVAGGTRSIRIAPLFFGRGSHLRDDLPRQIDAVCRRFPDVAFEVTETAGESDSVVGALAAFALHAPVHADGAKGTEAGSAHEREKREAGDRGAGKER